MSSTNKSLAERYTELQKREAAFERRKAIEPELKKFVEKGNITLAQKSAFSDIFAAIPDDLELSFLACDGKGVYEFLWYFLNHLNSPTETASFAAPNKKIRSKGVSYGNACISGSKICRKPLTPSQKEEVREILAVAPVPAKVKPLKIKTESEMSEEAEFAKIPEGRTKVVGDKTYVMKGSRWHSTQPDDRQNSVASVESQLGATVMPHVMTENTDEVFNALPGESSKQLSKRQDDFLNQKWGVEVATLDINQATYLPKIGAKKWDEAIAKLQTLPDGHVVAFHPDDKELFTDLFIKSATLGNGITCPVAKVKNNKIVSVFEDQKAVAAIRSARTEASTYMQSIHFDEEEDVRATKGMSKATIAAGRTINGENFKYGKAITPAAKAKLLKGEDEWHEKIDSMENTYLDRKPTGKHGDYAHYEQKSADWAKAKFGDFSEGANGFSLAQTKAHDIAHPVTHDLIGMGSDEIHSHFGKMKDASGNDALYAEEAIVNVMEQLSRGVSIEAATLNGVRLARVMTRNGVASEDARKYVRTPEFAQNLSQLANKAYRHNDFAPLIGHIRKSNRISGTVSAAGDNFSNSASGG